MSSAGASWAPAAGPGHGSGFLLHPRVCGVAWAWPCGEGSRVLGGSRSQGVCPPEVFVGWGACWQCSFISLWLCRDLPFWLGCPVFPLSSVLETVRPHEGCTVGPGARTVFTGSEGGFGVCWRAWEGLGGAPAGGGWRDVQTVAVCAVKEVRGLQPQGARAGQAQEATSSVQR